MPPLNPSLQLRKTALNYVTRAYLGLLKRIIIFTYVPERFKTNLLLGLIKQITTIVILLVSALCKKRNIQKIFFIIPQYLLYC